MSEYKAAASALTTASRPPAPWPARSLPSLTSVLPADRAVAFRALLAAPTVDLRELRALAFQGVPDERGLRAAVWRCLLGLLPPERAAWDRTLARKRAEYAQFCEASWRLVVHKDVILLDTSCAAAGAGFRGPHDGYGVSRVAHSV